MKKYVCILLMVTLVFSILAIQSVGAATEKNIKLTFWGWGPQVDAINNIAGPAFTKVHPNVTVEAIAMGPWDLMDKFYVSMVSGEGLPDCAQLVRRVMAKYLISDLLYDFTDFINIEHKGQFIEAFNKDVTSPDGKILAVAYDSGPSVLYYSKKLVDDLDINVDEIVTWDDFYNVCKKISDANPDIYILPLFYPGGSWGSNQWRFFIQSAGLNIYDDEGKVIRDNEKLKEINRFYYKLHSDVNVIETPVNDPAVYDATRKDKLLFWPSNTYRTSEIEQQAPELKGKIGVIPWPLWSKDALPLCGVWGGEGLVVPKKGPNVEMAAEFIKFLSTNEEALINGIWFASSGLPSYQPIREKIPEITDREAFATNLIESVMARKVSPWNFTSDWAQTEKILGDNLDAMMAGSMTPDEMWDTAEKQLIKTLGR